MSSKNGKILIILLFAIFSSLGYSLLAPLYPFEAKERDIGESMIGVIFSSFAFSNFLFIAAAPKLIKLIGKNDLLIMSLLIEGCCTCWFGLISFLNNKHLFLVISFVLRIMQGVGAALLQTIIYSVTAGFSCKEEIEKNIGYIEIGEAIGLAIGPIFASFGHYFFGFIFPFLFAGFLELCGIALVSKLEIEGLKEDDYDDEYSESSSSSEEETLANSEVKNEMTVHNFNSKTKVKNEERICDNLVGSVKYSNEFLDNFDIEGNKKVGVLNIIINVKVLAIFFGCFCDQVSDGFIMPVFAEFLTDRYKFKQEQTSFFFMISTCTYFISLQFLNIITSKLNNRKTIGIGWVFNSFFILFLGPDSLFPQSYTLTILGLTFMGCASCLITVPAVIELINIIKEDFAISEDEANDNASAIFNFGYTLGASVGPLYGGFLCEKYGFVKANRYNCLTSSTFFVFYLVVMLLNLYKRKGSKMEGKRLSVLSVGIK